VNVTALLAWRNLWRHRRRTWLVVAAMVFCNALLVFLVAIQLGSYRMMVDNTLGAMTGHVQVQHRGYHEDQEMREVVPRAVALADRLAGREDVTASAVRASGFALASSDSRSLGVELTGVQPDREPTVSTLPGLVRQGRYLHPGAAEVVLGAVLADNLKLAIGDELTFLGAGYDGATAAGVVTVVGLVDSGILDLDRYLAQVPLAYFQEAFALGPAAHAVVLRGGEPDQAAALAAAIGATLPPGEDLVALDWDTLQPGLKEAIRSDMASSWFMYGVLVILVALSVLNNQLMSVLERTREFGVMLALGLRPRRLAALVALETLLLALLGLVLGIALGTLVVWYFSLAGFSYPGMGEMAARFNLPPRIYPEFSLLTLTWGPAAVFLGALLAALYPALRLLTLRPVAAMRSV
jgi:putative ABC transport system permease protein